LWEKRDRERKKGLRVFGRGKQEELKKKMNKHNRSVNQQKVKKKQKLHSIWEA